MEDHVYTDHQCLTLGLKKGSSFQIIRECSCHIKFFDEQKLKFKIARNGFNPSYVHYDINDDYYTKDHNDPVKSWVKKYLDYFEKSERTRAAFCYFWGTNGTQKTSIAHYIGKELIATQNKVKYLLMNDLVHLLMQTERKEEAKKEVEDLDNYDLLILDESWDIQKITIYSSQFQLPFLDTFLRNRLQKRKGIIFISNVCPSDMSPKFGDSLKDLVIREIEKEKSELKFAHKYRDIISKIDDNGLFS
jgi:DNA replication protein DnaC